MKMTHSIAQLRANLAAQKLKENLFVKKVKFVLSALFLVILLVIGVRANATETITGQTQVSNVGWTTPKSISEGQVLDLTAYGRIESVKFSVGGDVSSGISYTGNAQNYGWQNSVSDGQVAGTVGQGLSLEGLKMNLTGTLANNYDIYYRAQISLYGWLGWVKDGAESGTLGLGYNNAVVTSNLQVTGLQVFIVKKGASLPITIDSTQKTEITVDQSTKEILTGQVCIQDGVWQPTQTVLESQGIDFNIPVNAGQYVTQAKFNVSGPVSGGIVYKVQSQNIGWSGATATNGQTVGSAGLRLETISVNLTGDLASKYDIYYQAYVQNYGWLGWTRDGGNAGSENHGLQIQDLRIMLSLKGGSFSGYPSTTNSDIVGASYTTYTSATNPNVWAYHYYAVKTAGGVDNGLYSDPVGTGLSLAPIANATDYNKYIGYADQEASVNGTTYTHIYLTKTGNTDGNWYWINSNDLSWEKTEVNNDGTVNHPVGPNAYNKEGEIRYALDPSLGSNFAQSLKDAITTWNSSLGNVILPADNQHPATMLIRYRTTDDSGKLIPSTTPSYDLSNLVKATWPDGTIYQYRNNVTLTINANVIPTTADPGVVRSLFIHELGHALGLGHTGDGGGANNNVVSWSWATIADNDVMWTGGPTNAQEVLTPQDKAAAQLARTLKMYATIDQ